MHEVVVRAEPQRLHRPARHARRLLGRHEAAERAKPRETRCLLTLGARERRAAHRRVDPVRANDRVGRRFNALPAPALEGERNGVLILAHPGQAVVEAQAFFG